MTSTISPRRRLFTSLLLTIALNFSLSCYGQTSSSPDSITIAIAPEYDEVGKTHRFFFGENYRKLWATPVKLRVFKLLEEKGGLQIVERGGGMQTKSLRLKDSSGREWVLRSVQKDPEKALPVNLRPTVAKDILQDLISTSHPYAAITVPPLATALEVPHTNPEIIFMPDDPALGEYRKDFANTVLLFEERGPLDIEDTDNTEKVLKKMEEDNDNRIAQKQVLRARLLDIIVGDWDRHEDQWRWLKVKDDTGTIYRPYPRDRDQVYYISEGVFPSMASRKWILPKFQGFQKDIRDINGFNFNARYFDRTFLNGLSQADWEEEIAFVQSRLTDEVIASAIRKLPDTIYKLSGKEIIEKLIARRNNLKEEGLKYFRFISKTVDIPTSDKRELFKADYGSKGDLTLTVHKQKKDDSIGQVIYHRSFQPNITEEVRLYGRGGEDIFMVTGAKHSKIKLRMIGGGDRDSFHLENKKAKLYVYDRKDKENVLPARSTAHLRLSNDSSVNEYNQKNFRYNKLAPRAYVGYNIDDGVILGAGLTYEKHGFRKEPYAVMHRLLVGHALATSAFFITYSGNWRQIAGGKLGLSFDVDARTPNNSSNFFGVGNETVFDKDGGKSISYYRTRYNFTNTTFRLNRPTGKHLNISAGLAGQFYKNSSSKNEGRFINVYDSENPEEDVFSEKVFAGLVGGVELDSRNNKSWPIGGIYWNTTLTGMRQVNKQQNKFGQFVTDFSFYFPLGKDSNFVVANRIGAGTTFGEPAFFQQLYLGGNLNLRGFRNYRFAGESMLFHNIELRMKLFDFTSYLLPGTFGLTLFNDVGRVWVDGEESKKWHDGFGAGIYIIPAALVLIQGTVGISTEGALPNVSIGFRF
ncbi:outer membrane protein assembly factor [Chitinophagaceae bacterium LB-8]|uniref:Outer membrane protein assembly factor n=1 Tax=Paraflavisolibacter caeni TaxID=2982496 RepID=A0A9X2XWJ0_9BACT|nr:BamA/TamA family outer membrane protein [Paraflavisolibacter caeni]MCU7550365.1 outer membrane protein assembly factor [Paraflavisolibacter caeni]